jgi:hypothetical protein
LVLPNKPAGICRLFSGEFMFKVTDRTPGIVGEGIKNLLAADLDSYEMKVLMQSIWHSCLTIQRFTEQASGELITTFDSLDIRMEKEELENLIQLLCIQELVRVDTEGVLAETLHEQNVLLLGEDAASKIKGRDFLSRHKMNLALVKLRFSRGALADWIIDQHPKLTPGGVL